MTEKKRRIIRGREIRKATGIKLPVAMQLAKAERHGIPSAEKFGGAVVVEREAFDTHGPYGEQDVWVTVRVYYVGPRGKMVGWEETV